MIDDDVIKVLRRDTILYHYIPTYYFSSTCYSEDFHAIFREAEIKRKAKKKKKKAQNGSQGGGIIRANTY